MKLDEWGSNTFRKRSRASPADVETAGAAASAPYNYKTGDNWLSVVTQQQQGIDREGGQCLERAERVTGEGRLGQLSRPYST